MKLPRDLGGEELAKLLKKYGYEVTRQTGSHMRLFWINSPTGDLPNLFNFSLLPINSR